MYALAHLGPKERYRPRIGKKSSPGFSTIRSGGRHCQDYLRLNVGYTEERFKEDKSAFSLTNRLIYGTGKISSPKPLCSRMGTLRVYPGITPEVKEMMPYLIQHVPRGWTAVPGHQDLELFAKREIETPLLAFRKNKKRGLCARLLQRVHG